MQEVPPPALTSTSGWFARICESRLKVPRPQGCSDSCEVEQEEMARSLLDRLVREVEWAGRFPDAGRPDSRAAIEEVETEHRPFCTQFVDNRAQRAGAIERLEAGHNGARGAIELEQSSSRFPIAQSGIDNQVKAD